MKNDWIFAWASLALAVTAFWALALFLQQIVPAPIPDVGLFLPEYRQAVQPEPLERLTFLAGLLCIPALPTCSYWWLTRKGRIAPAWLRRPIVLVLRDVLLVGAGFVWLNWLTEASQVPGMSKYLVAALACSAVLSVLAIKTAVPTGKRVLPIVVCVAVLLLAWRTQIINDNWFLLEFNLWHHVDILMGAVNGILHGRTVLIDMSSQYGILWPYVAALAIWPLGLSVPSISHFFAALMLLQILFVYLGLGRRFGYGSWSTAIFLTAYVGLTHTLFVFLPFNIPNTLLRTTQYVYACVPTYYQWAPLRTFWGGVFFWFVPLSYRATRRRAVLGYCLGGLAFLWNFDQGIVVLGAFTLQLAYQRLHEWRMDPRGVAVHAARHVAAGAATLLGSLLVYCVFALVRSGHWPDLWGSLVFQSAFYGSGFYMLPMRFRELWQAVVAVQLVTLAWCLRRAVRGEMSGDAAWRFFLAIAGLGVLSYYQGRSMAAFLATSFSPALLLSCSWVHEGIETLRRRGIRLISDPADRYKAATTLLFSLWITFGFVNFLRALPDAISFARDSSGPPRDAASLEPVWVALKKEIEGRAVVMLAEPGAFIHAKTASYSALTVAANEEVLLQQQLVDIQRVVDKPETIVVFNGSSAPFWARHIALRGFTSHELPGGFAILKH
jgi:hypothetical protein